MEHPEYSATSEISLALREAATHTAEFAYAPYSNFRVGAALLLEDGSVVTGCNVENMSYGLTICAERAAMARAISEKGPEVRVRAIAVANLNGAASPPCGACRQVLHEFVTPDAWVIFPADNGIESLPFSELLPFGFHFDRS